VPGTEKAADLEQMYYIYAVRTRKHVRYQLTEVLPWVLGLKEKLLPMHLWISNQIQGEPDGQELDTVHSEDEEEEEDPQPAAHE